MNEEWRPIKGLEDAYEVSNLGRVRSLDRFVRNPGNRSGGCRQKGKTLKACAAKNGYCVVNVGRSRTQYVHRLVTEAFIGKIPHGMTVNHKDGNKNNNNVENLEIVTYSENHLHAFRELGRTPTCKDKTNTSASKPVEQLSDGKVVATFPSAREAERQTGVSFKGISACCHGRAYTAGGYEWRLSHGAEPPKAPIYAQK